MRVCVQANTEACVYVCARDWLSHVRGSEWAGCGVEVCKCKHICMCRVDKHMRAQARRHVGICHHLQAQGGVDDARLLRTHRTSTGFYIFLRPAVRTRRMLQRSPFALALVFTLPISTALFRCEFCDSCNRALGGRRCAKALFGMRDGSPSARSRVRIVVPVQGTPLIDLGLGFGFRDLGLGFRI